MPTAEGVFPKVGADPLYYSEVNNLYSQILRQTAISEYNFLYSMAGSFISGLAQPELIVLLGSPYLSAKTSASGTSNPWNYSGTGLMFTYNGIYVGGSDIDNFNSASGAYASDNVWTTGANTQSDFTYVRSGGYIAFSHDTAGNVASLVASKAGGINFAGSNYSIYLSFMTRGNDAVGSFKLGSGLAGSPFVRLIGSENWRNGGSTWTPYRIDINSGAQTCNVWDLSFEGTGSLIKSGASLITLGNTYYPVIAVDAYTLGFGTSIYCNYLGYRYNNASTYTGSFFFPIRAVSGARTGFVTALVSGGSVNFNGTSDSYSTVTNIPLNGIANLPNSTGSVGMFVTLSAIGSTATTYLGNMITYMTR